MQKASLGGLAVGSAFFGKPIEETLEYTTQKVARYSAPSDLKITDMRIAQYGNVPLLKIDTNQGIYGLGDVRDGADKRYALFLKSRLLGENPCNVEMLFKKIQQFGGHGRQGGGVSGVEMALWDLAGKAHGVPVYQMMGGKYRDKVRIYVDTPTVRDPDQFAQRMKDRVDKGFTVLKMDVGIGLIKDIPGTLVNTEPWGEMRGWTDREVTSYAQTMHPFTRVQITDKGIEHLVEYVAKTRELVGYEIPLGIDHLGHMGVNSMIKLGKAFEPYTLSWLEDMVPWQNYEDWKTISEALDTPTMTGEDIYHKNNFRDLIVNKAVDIVHPDPGSTGGLLQTKLIGDMAEEYGIAMAVHHAASPVSFMGTVHAIAATQNFIALEHHSVDTEWWEDLVTGIEKPIVQNGYVNVPEKPGIGVELNEDVVKEHLAKGEKYFAPTPEWDELRSWDRIWS
ncbi:mandelate racemase/muconate lactonizing enzyme family protein [Catalinimonas niigatensis]|nr:mandelate racemase/muconate lactonizing enzyme family protein [Catalinimonas niigatensis]WPP53724.1 mandelate racemase/muconate lactonizing enzyme family protein [Catalinimonas niigatensis]